MSEETEINSSASNPTENPSPDEPQGDEIEATPNELAPVPEADAPGEVNITEPEVVLKGSEATQPLPSKPEKTKTHRKRISLFFPLLLIFIGVVFLLRNFGYINADTWDLLVNLWPLIFIALGLDGLWRGDGLSGATFSLGIGIVFLLGNFGFLQMSPWLILITLWPILLIAVGFDILIGRYKSCWSTLVGMVIILGILAGALWLSGVRLPGGQTLQGETIEIPLQDAQQARIHIEPVAGRLILDRTDDPEFLLIGTVPPSRQGSSIVVESSQEGSLAKVDIHSSGVQFFYTPDQMAWDLAMTGDVPVDLSINLAAGESLVNLDGLILDNLDYSLAVGSVQVVLPEADSFNGELSGAIGTLRIIVPENIGLEIQMNTALVYRSIPDSYHRSENLYTSPNFEEAEYRIRLVVDLAIGQVMVEQK